MPTPRVRAVTRPLAVATGYWIQPTMNNIVDRKTRATWLSVGSGRYHHPTRAARAGTPVRLRFCNKRFPYTWY
jgi:hypothetical protein